MNRFFVTVASLVLLALALLVPASASAQWSRYSEIPELDIPEGHAHLMVITNFDNTEVEINGTSYPYEWIYGESQGVFVPADINYEVVVSTSPEQRRTFRFRLDEGESRILVVDVENMGRVTTSAPRPRDEVEEEEEEEEEEETDEIGYLGVSSSPRGIVHVDGESTGQRTPARRIELEPGRHEVTVFYDEEEEMSEVKHVLIRAGVNTNVFFRYRRDD